MQHITDPDHVKTATASIINLPIGTIMPYAGDVAAVATLKAQGWLLCDGASVSQQEYDQLFALMRSACGQTQTHFNLPDFQGVFLRGFDGEKGRDPDRDTRTAQVVGGNTGNKVLTRQEDEFKEHSHNLDIVVHHDNIKCANENEYWRPAVDNVNRTTSNTGGRETRPKNVTVNYIIFAGIPKS